jgi:carboxyl-terminal processing protease
MNRSTLALAVASVVALSGVAGAQKFIGSPAQDLFDQVSFYLDTQYFGPSKADIAQLTAKWQVEVDKVCEPQGAQCSFDKVEPIIEAMMAELQDGHAYYLSPDDIRAERANAQGTNNSPVLRAGIASRNFCDTPTGACTTDNAGNLTSRLLPDRFVANVVTGSPADKAGVKYGDRWIGHNGVLYNSVQTGTDAYTALVNDFGTRIRAGETVTVILLRGPQRQRLELPIKGEIINAAEQPTMELRSDGVGILTIKDYLIRGVGQRVHNLVGDAMTKSVKGIIVNMRNNGGGYGDERALAQGAFMENPEFFRRQPRYNADKNSITEGYVTAQGAWVARDVNGVELGRNAVQNPQLFRGPIAVLVNRGCGSACEYFASAVQRAKRGPVIGEDTAGIGNTNSTRLQLANGGAAAMPTVQAFWLDGTPLPATVKPDIATPNYEFNLFNTGVDVGIQEGLKAVGAAPTLNVATSKITLSSVAPLPAFGGMDALNGALERINPRVAATGFSSL